MNKTNLDPAELHALRLRLLRLIINRPTHRPFGTLGESLESYPVAYVEGSRIIVWLSDEECEEWRPDKEIAQAFEVLDARLDRAMFSAVHIGTTPLGRWYCRLKINESWFKERGCNHPALAICLALDQASGAEGVAETEKESPME